MNKEERELFMAMGETLGQISATLRREPDLVTLRSTNDADVIDELSQRYDAWFWGQPEGEKIIAELKEEDE